MENNTSEYVDYEEVKEELTPEQQKENELVERAKQNEDFARNFMKLHTPLTATKLPGRNDICPFCDSGLKFKKCECYKTHIKEHKNQYYL